MIVVSIMQITITKVNEQYDGIVLEGLCDLEGVEHFISWLDYDDVNGDHYIICETDRKQSNSPEDLMKIYQTSKKIYYWFTNKEEIKVIKFEDIPKDCLPLL